MVEAEEKAVKILQEMFNFNRYQAKAYVAVLSGAGRPKEIARRAKIPVTRVYDVLSHLIDEGLIRKTSSGFVSAEPSHALTNMLRNQRLKIESVFEEKTKSLGALLSLINEFRKTSAEKTETAILRGLTPVVVKLLEMAGSADEFVFAVRKAAKLKDEFKKVVGQFRGKKFVFLLHPSVEVREEDRAFFRKIDAKVLVSQAVLFDILVTDAGEALIGLPLDDEPVVVWVKDAGFATSLMRSLMELERP